MNDPFNDEEDILDVYEPDDEYPEERELLFSDEQIEGFEQILNGTIFWGTLDSINAIGKDLHEYLSNSGRYKKNIKLVARGVYTQERGGELVGYLARTVQSALDSFYFDSDGSVIHINRDGSWEAGGEENLEEVKILAFYLKEVRETSEFEDYSSKSSETIYAYSFRLEETPSR